MSLDKISRPSAHSLSYIEKWINTEPIADWLSIQASLQNEAHAYQLSFQERHIGNPVARNIHGGVISSFLQTAALLDINSRLPIPANTKVISIHCSYLRPAKATDMQASISIVQIGRRIAFIEASAWQQSADKPVALAAVAIQLTPLENS